MPARLLVCARDSRGSGPGQYRKGMVVVVAPDGHEWGSMEGLPDFIQVDVSDASPAEIAAWRDEWRQNIDWDVVNSDLSVDGHRLRIWTTNRRASDGLGDITRAQAVSFLERWSAVNIVAESRPTGEAGVRFDISVYGAATSEGFWDRDLTGFSFAELVYVEGSGRHDIRVTYPAGLSHTRVLAEMTDRGVPLLADSEPDRTVDYRVTRDAMLVEFKAKVKETLQGTVMRRQLYVDPADVDAVVTLGGSITRIKAQVEASMRDARND